MGILVLFDSMPLMSNALLNEISNRTSRYPIQYKAGRAKPHSVDQEMSALGIVLLCKWRYWAILIGPEPLRLE